MTFKVVLFLLNIEDLRYFIEYVCKLRDKLEEKLCVFLISFDGIN